MPQPESPMRPMVSTRSSAHGPGGLGTGNSRAGWMRWMAFCWGVAVLSSIAMGQSKDEQGSVSVPTASSVDSMRLPVRVRVDAYHAHTWLETLPRPGLTSYHLLHGPARAVAALQAMGWECEAQLGPWTEAELLETDLIVINLVSADRPPFLVSEINALMAFLRRGGGAIVITDHTNCYFHNHVLGAWFHELGLQLSHHLACDRPPNTLAEGHAWINIESFADHPVVSGLRNVGFFSGGCVDSRHAIAWTSPLGWADEGRIPAYGEGTSVGFFGDSKQQPAETSGAIPVLAAKNIGAGRIVVIADQNCIGGAHLNYADNRRMWLQSAVWAALGTESQPASRASLVDRGLDTESDRTLVWCLEPLSEHRSFWANTTPEGFCNAFVFLNKHADARGTDRSLFHAAWMIIPDPELLERSPWREHVRDFLAQPERHAVVLGTTQFQASLDAWSKWAWSDPSVLTSVPTVASLNGVVSTDASERNILTFRVPSGSHLHWHQMGSEWTNAQVPFPDVARNEADEKADDAKLNWLWELGLQRVPSMADQVYWPED